VSFRAFDVVRKIKFSEDQKQKYWRVLFPSKYKLGKTCRQLEAFGENLLPYTLTDNSVKFDVKTAVRFLFEYYGLACVFENDRSKMVTVAATVDGGNLAWCLTQVSAEIKIVDPRALDPATGEPLFGESGYDKLQSKIHCYPLHVFITKDNKELYQTNLSQFFHYVNSFEEDFPNSF
jgi:hypothetical protein